MAIDFPSSPSSGQQHSHNDSLWEWDGSSWNRVGGLINTNATQLVGIAATQFARRDIDNIITGVTTFIGNGYTGVGNTVLIVEGDARVTGVLSIGQGSVSINERDISAVGVITGSNFKTGTTNVHNVGVEAAGINVLGADTPIGTGATVYNSGLVVSKSGAEYQGVVTALGGFNVGVSSGGTSITTGIITAINFIGTGNTVVYNSSTKVVDVSISGSAGAGGTWSSYAAGIATTKTAVGISTDNLDDKDLTGIGNSFKGMYISNGMMIYDNALSGNHYIGTAFNGLMAGPVTIHGTLSVDGQYVVV